MEGKSRLTALKAGTKNVKTIKYPGTDTELALRVLTNEETQRAAFDTERYFGLEKINFGPPTVDAYEDEVLTRSLFFAMRDPADNDNTFAESVDELRKLITVEEKAVLVAEYNAHEGDCSPRISELTDKDFEEMIADVKKSPGMLNSLSSDLLRRLLAYSVSRGASSRTDSGSIS